MKKKKKEESEQEVEEWPGRRWTGYIKWTKKLIGQAAHGRRLH